MYRPRLRSRNGCIRCRSRKKKCDEVHPVCQNCQCLGVICKWSTSQEISGPTHQELTPIPLPRVREVSNGYEPFKDSTSFGLYMMMIQSVHKFTAMPESGQSGDMSIILTVGLQYAWIRNAMISWTALQRGATLHRFALGCYQSACISLRHQLNFDAETSAVNGVPILIGVIFLGLFESTQNVPPVASLFHFTAAINILSRATWVGKVTGMDTFLTFAAKLSVYYVKFLAFLHTDCDMILQCVNLYRLQGIAIPPDESPLIGFTIRLVIIALQAILCGRTNHPESVRGMMVDQLLQEVSTVQFELLTAIPRLPTLERDVFALRVQLYIRALNILLWTNRGYRQHSSNNMIREEAEAAFTTLSTTLPTNPGMSWPVWVILCTVERPEQVELVEAQLERMVPTAYVAHRNWLDLMLTEFRQHRRTQESSDLRDSLDLLCRPHGLLGKAS